MARPVLESFPLPWERLLWSSAPGFFSRLLHPDTKYVLTDFRVAIRRGDNTLHEIAIDDIADVRLEQSRWQRFTATSSVVIDAKRPGRSISLNDVREGPQLALILQLMATDHFAARIDEEFVRSAIGPGAPRLLHPNRMLLAFAASLCVLSLGFVGARQRTTLAPEAYAADDPIAPAGHRRDLASIVAFMERDVMPFARRALAPVAGGATNVRCETCHGEDAEARQWKMPGVRALPEPEVRLAGMERMGFWLDPQVRNAVYGYLAEEEKLPTAAYMRQVVMPGMAAVLHRPAYDFTKTYGYNREHVAVGCYHCHLVDSAFALQRPVK